MAGSRGRAQGAGFGLFGLMVYIGAAIYFVSHSDGSFWGVILGLLQALVWPVYVVFQVLTAVGA
jgi:drug/metabolite transporter (DMT)-like permease